MHNIFKLSNKKVIIFF